MAHFPWKAKAVFITLFTVDLLFLALIVTLKDTPAVQHPKVSISDKNKKKEQQHEIELLLVQLKRSGALQNEWYESCRIKLSDTLMRTNQSCLAGIYKDILLVIVYHYPFYESIPTFIKFYSVAFKKIVICGPLESESYKIMKVDLKNGYYAYECLGQAIRENPLGYTGYMYINDDVLVNWWNLRHFDTNRIWAGSEMGLGAEVGKPEPNDGWGGWSKSSPGLKTCVQTINQIENLANSGTISWLNSSYNTYINNSRGKRYCRAGLTDFFYVPRRFAHKYQALSNMFFRNKVFLEIAAPTTLTFLDNESNFEHVYGFYLPKKYGYIDFSSGKEFWTEYNYKPLYFMHPFKLHTSRLNEFLFKAYVQFYADKVNQCEQ